MVDESDKKRNQTPTGLGADKKRELPLLEDFYDRQTNSLTEAAARFIKELRDKNRQGWKYFEGRVPIHPGTLSSLVSRHANVKIKDKDKVPRPISKRMQEDLYRGIKQVAENPSVAMELTPPRQIALEDLGRQAEALGYQATFTKILGR